ncbi:hypothetical protein Tco_0385839 [Tanacetum coccineum]
MAYSSSSLFEQDTFSSLETFHALSASDLYFSFLTLEIFESFSSTASITPTLQYLVYNEDESNYNYCMMYKNQKYDLDNAMEMRNKEMDIRQKNEKRRQNRARDGRAWKSQSQKVKVNQVKVNPAKSKVKAEADIEEILNGPTRSRLSWEETLYLGRMPVYLWDDAPNIAKEEGLLKFLRGRCDDLRRKNARRCVMIREMEALGERRVAVDSLESLKQTHARETVKLAALTDAIVESLAGIHEKERHVAKIDLND